MAIQWQYTFSAQLCRTNSPTGHTVFFHSAHNDTAWSTVAVTLSVSIDRYLSYPTEQYPEQSSNTDSWIDEGRACHVFHEALCIGVVAALWRHLIFTHPTAMDSNFRSETIYVVTRLAWCLGLAVGSEVEVDLEVTCSVFFLQLSKWLFCLKRERFFCPWNLRKIKEPKSLFEWASFCKKAPFEKTKNSAGW